MTPTKEELRLMTRVRELEEELEEWRRQDGLRDSDDSVAIWRNALGVRGQAAKIVMLLCGAPGRFVSRDYLHENITEGSSGYNLVNVAVCHARVALRKRGFSDVIRSSWGHGYMITPEGAAQVRALVNQ